MTEDTLAGRRRRGLAAAAVAVALAVAGCASSPSPRTGGGPSGPGARGGPSGPVTPGAIATPTPPAGEPSGTGSRSGVENGALFGGDLPLVPETAKLSRRLAIVRAYFTLGEQFPTAQARSAMRAGSSLLVSLDSAPKKRQGSYASIAAGQHDAAIRRFLQRMEQAAVRYHLGAIYFSFEHEANTPPHRALGTPAQFVQAWDHIHQLASSAHLLWDQGGRLHFVLILTHTAYFPLSARPRWAVAQGQASSYFPGASEVDIVGVDGYNFANCQRTSLTAGLVARNAPSVTPEALFDPAVSFARSHGGLPVFIAEWASVAYSGSAEQATFIAQMRAFVSANHEIAAAMYWNARSPRSRQSPGCLMSLNHQPTSLSELAAMGHAPGLQGRIVAPGAQG